LFIPAVGGPQNAGATNQTASNLVKITNIFGTAIQATVVLTGDVVPTPTGAKPTWDITGFAAALRMGGVAYVQTGMYSSSYISENYTYYKTTVSKLLAITTSVSLWNAFQQGILEIAEEGAVTSSFSSPRGIYFHDLLIAMGDTPEEDELFVFQGSKIKICDALVYEARSLGFGLGIEDGQIGGYNVNSVDATWESERQIRSGIHYKHGLRALRLAAAIAEAEKEDADKK
jgi:hypothetical protein